MKLVVYTAIFGEYDKLKEFSFNKRNIEYICFTDQKNMKSKSWKIIYIDTDVKSATDINRKIKINVLDYLAEYDKSIYIDGNMQVLNDLEPFFSNLGDYPMAALKHSSRSCIYIEANECIRIGKTGNEILNQVEEYKKQGFPENFGMTENGILIRDHNNPELKNILSLWWDYYTNGIKRDQISLPFITWKFNLSINKMEFNPRRPNGYLRLWQHGNKYKGLKKTWYYFRAYINGKEWREMIKDART